MRYNIKSIRRKVYERDMYEDTILVLAVGKPRAIPWPG
jgi:hypothetical protein